jgi:glucokinase
MKQPVIALDAGGTKLLAGVVSEGGEVSSRTVRNWPADRSRDAILACFVSAVDELRDAAPGVEAIGAGIPATLDLESGVVAGCRHLPLAGFAFRDWLAGATGLTAYVDNDATLALVAEHRLGAARGAADATMLTIGTGIGGGIVAGGRVVRGARGAAGEPGHMTIHADGPPCPGDCAGYGCLEVYVSGPALARDDLSAANVVDAARAGDVGARAALERMGTDLGIGIANLLNLLDPDVVVVGGGLGSHAAELLLEPAERIARARALEPAASRARFTVAELGESAGMIGAGLLALAEGEI